jgi:hypothetical protein
MSAPRGQPSALLDSSDAVIGPHDWRSIARIALVQAHKCQRRTGARASARLGLRDDFDVFALLGTESRGPAQRGTVCHVGSERLDHIGVSTDALRLGRHASRERHGDSENSDFHRSSCSSSYRLTLTQLERRAA